MKQLILLFVFLFPAALIAQDHVRIATYNVAFDRKGPGLLLKDILDQDAQVLAVAGVIALNAPDIILLTAFDTDYQNQALRAFAALLADQGLVYPYIMGESGNAGRRSGVDINQNGRLNDWADNWGFGRFEGNKSMALLSRFPLGLDEIRRFNTLLWQDQPGVIRPDGLPDALWAQLRLSSRGHVDLPVLLPNGQRINLLMSYPTPPVFDGPNDFNGLRNDAEIRFWVEYLNGMEIRDDAGNVAGFEGAKFVLLADLNADLDKGEGLGIALAQLLNHALVQDLNMGPSANWEEPMRVDYVLPSAGLTVVDHGVYWPSEPELLAQAETKHRLVWVDLALP